VTMHLRGRIGAYGLLIQAASILDVWAAEPAADGPPAWRGRAVPYVDGRSLLGEPAAGAAPALLAYGAAADDPGLVILGLDEVLGSVEITPDMLKPFPPALGPAYRLFDGIATVPGEATTLLRLRRGLDLALQAQIRGRSPTAA
jgi:hypothetical protein